MKKVLTLLLVVAMLATSVVLLASCSKDPIYIGVQTGTTGDMYCTDEDGTSEVKVGEVKRYEKGMDAASDLMAGRIDAVVIDNFVAQKLAEKNPDKIVKLDDALTEEEYAIALTKDSELTAKFNEVLKDLTDSGKLDEIETKYLGDGTGSETEAETEAATEAE